MKQVIDEKILESIIKQAIQEGKLFELLFTDNGRRLWSSWPEDKMKKKVKQILQKKREDIYND